MTSSPKQGPARPPGPVREPVREPAGAAGRGRGTGRARRVRRVVAVLLLIIALGMLLPAAGRERPHRGDPCRPWLSPVSGRIQRLLPGRLPGCHGAGAPSPAPSHPRDPRDRSDRP